MRQPLTRCDLETGARAVSADGARALQDRPRDYYHTCYALSGMSLAQHGIDPSASEPLAIGPKENLLEATDPMHNVSAAKVKQAQAYFSSLPNYNVVQK